MSGRLISRHSQSRRVCVEDYRLLFATTPKQRAAVLKQIEKRSQAAKAGWVKRRQHSTPEGESGLPEGPSKP